jgi:hypothetical protein
MALATNGSQELGLFRMVVKYGYQIILLDVEKN